MPARKSRTPDKAGASSVAASLYADLKDVEWIPSDDADVFRLTFTSGREPRILKLAAQGIVAVWRELGAFPAMRRLGVPEVLEFEYTSEDLPGTTCEFHITRELGNPATANRAWADAWTNHRDRALEIATWLGDCVRRIEVLDWRDVPRANNPERAVEQGDDWLKPQHACLTSRADCPGWAIQFLEEVDDELTQPPQSFGGWGGEMLLAPKGDFVLIDWPGLGAAHEGSQAATALEVLLRFRADEPAPLVERFLQGWSPGSIDAKRLEHLRRRWAHSILWWAGLNLQMGGDPHVDLTRTYTDAAYVLETYDPVAWVRRAGAFANA